MQKIDKEWIKDHRWHIWKAILVLALLGTLLFIYHQRINFLVSKKYLNGTEIEEKRYDAIAKLQEKYANDPEFLAKDATRMMFKQHQSDNAVDMEGNKEVIQYFSALESRIVNINLIFANMDSSKTQGTVHVYLETENGELIKETELAAGKIAHYAPTKFSMTGNTEFLNANETATSVEQSKKNPYGIRIKKGHRYRYRIVSEDVSSQSGFLLCLNQNKEKTTNTLVYEGKEMTDDHLFATEEYKHFSIRLFLIFLLGILLGIVFVLFPWSKLEPALNKKLADNGHKPMDLERTLLRIMFVLTPLFEVVMLAKIADMRSLPMLQMIFSIKGVLNLMLTGFFLWVFYVITNRIKAAIVLVTAGCLALGFANYALLQFRDSPLVASDIASLKTAMQVTATYSLQLDKQALWAIMLTAVWVCAALSLRGGKGVRWKARLVCLAVAIAWGLLCDMVMFHSSVLQDNGIVISSFKPRWNYKRNGYMLSFWVSVDMVVVDKPDGYSVEKVESIMKDYQSDKATSTDTVTEQKPNIIIVMNESFSDLRANGEFATNQEYMPFYYSLKENTIKGVAHSSVYGGTTACSEFECLTGFSMNFLPFHSVPFNNTMKTDTPSLTNKLESASYGGLIAFHPGMETSYNRNEAYPKLGFKEHISVEDMDDPERIRAYVSDKADYERVEEEYEKYKKSEDGDKPFFMFNVTIQNHGSYGTSNGVVDAGISITEPSLQMEQATTFVNLMKKSDDALKRLIKYFSNVDEPTVILLFGDHQPRVEETFYPTLDQMTGWKGNEVETADRKYRVPFMIWSNYDIEEQENVEISINYLSSYLLQQIGGEMSAYDKYLMDLRETLPVITDIAVVDKDGKYYDPDDKKNPYAKLLEEYQIVQYNGFMDDKHRVNELFQLKKDNQ